MRALSLAMYPADIRAISTVDFEGLARVFKRSEWAEVEEVRVVISNKGECGLGTVVKQQLSVLNDRRVLRVSVGFDERLEPPWLTQGFSKARLLTRTGASPIRSSNCSRA